MRGELVEAFTQMMASTSLAGMASIYLAEAMRPALWLGDPVRARRVAEALTAQPDAHDILPSAELTALRAGIAALEGRREEALAGYREAITQLGDCGLDFEVARLKLDAIIVLGAAGPEVRAWADGARAVFERLGARPYLDRLAQATTGAPAGDRAGTSSRGRAATPS
jgi:hypothetical protein